MTAPPRVLVSGYGRPAFDWDPFAAVPDWVVLGLIRERLIAGDPVPESLCPREEVPDYIPALVAAGHTTSEIATATGVNAHRIYKRSTR